MEQAVASENGGAGGAGIKGWKKLRNVGQFGTSLAKLAAESSEDAGSASAKPLKSANTNETKGMDEKQPAQTISTCRAAAVDLASKVELLDRNVDDFGAPPIVSLQKPAIVPFDHHPARAMADRKLKNLISHMNQMQTGIDQLLSANDDKNADLI